MRLRVILSVLALVLLAACGSDDDTATTTGDSPSMPTATPERTPVQEATTDPGGDAEAADTATESPLGDDDLTATSTPAANSSATATSSLPGNPAEEPTATWTPERSYPAVATWTTEATTEPTATWTAEPAYTATATWTPEPTATWTAEPTYTPTPTPRSTTARAALSVSSTPSDAEVECGLQLVNGVVTPGTGQVLGATPITIDLTQWEAETWIDEFGSVYCLITKVGYDDYLAVLNVGSGFEAGRTYTISADLTAAQ